MAASMLTIATATTTSVTMEHSITAYDEEQRLMQAIAAFLFSPIRTDCTPLTAKSAQGADLPRAL